MYYTNKETFVLSADGCMDTERGGLESILAGNDEGAKGCCFSVAMSADGIAVLSSDGCAAAPDGTRLPVSDYSYAELHQAAPQLTPVSQAIELARTCQGKIAITVHDQTMLRQLRMTLRYADCLDDTIIIGLGLVEAARVASANPDLHIMGELPNLPSEIDALVNAAQTTGLIRSEGRAEGFIRAAGFGVPTGGAVHHEPMHGRSQYACGTHTQRRKLYRNTPAGHYGGAAACR